MFNISYAVKINWGLLEFYYKINNILCLHFDSFLVKPSHRPPIVFYHLEWEKGSCYYITNCHPKCIARLLILKLPQCENSYCNRWFHSPEPFSKKTTVDSGLMFWPVISISSPPVTEPQAGLKLSIWGSSWANLWASQEKENGFKLLRKCSSIWPGVNIFKIMASICTLDPKNAPPKRFTLKIHDRKNSQHSIGVDATCSDSTFPLCWGIWTRNTARTRVFLRPISVSPFRSSMSELRSFRIPAQSMLSTKDDKSQLNCVYLIKLHLSMEMKPELYNWHCLLPVAQSNF